MKPRVIAYVADNSTLNGWLVQLASLSENYNCIAVSSRDKILDYLHNKPLSLLVMQLEMISLSVWIKRSAFATVTRAGANPSFSRCFS